MTRHVPQRSVPGTMRAIVRDRYGSTEVLGLGDLPLPDIDEDGVLLRVRAAGVDRGVWHIMAGVPYLARLAFGVRRPRTRTLGREVAGVVEAAGARVTALRPGDEVFGTCDGSFAEYAAAKPAKLARKPSNLTFEQAAAVPVSGQTALQVVRDHGRVRAGQRVLVIGASGGVGVFAVQVAKAMGAEVTGVCSAAKADLVRSVGADHVIDYARAEITDDGRRYDVVLDLAGNRPLRLLRRVLTHDGTLVIVGGEEGGRWTGVGRQFRAVTLSPFVRQRLRAFVTRENSRDLGSLTALIEAGDVTPVVDSARPLSDVPRAVDDLVAGRIRGKAVIVP